MRRLSGLALGMLMLAPAMAAPTYASRAEFSRAIVGKTISSISKKGRAFTAVIKPDGSGDFHMTGRDPTTFRWTFSGETFCWEFSDFSECNKVEIVSPKAANFYDARTGVLNNAYKVR